MQAEKNYKASRGKLQSIRHYNYGYQHTCIFKSNHRDRLQPTSRGDAKMNQEQLSTQPTSHERGIENNYILQHRTEEGSQTTKKLCF